MKTKRDLENLVGQTVTEIRTDILGNLEIVIGDDVLSVRDILGATELTLNEELLSAFTYIDLDEWLSVVDAFPDFTINGSDLHFSSTIDPQGMSMHAKWTADTGCIIKINDIKSFDGKDIVLDQSGFCEAEE